MRAYVCLGVSLLSAGCGSVRIVAASVDETGVAASCVGLSPAEQFATARLVFVGRMLHGSTTERGVLVSPARVRVERYLKGRGPRTVRVDTAVTIEGNATAVVEDGIYPRAGQRWRIYTSSRRQPYDTSICAGSGRVG